MEKRILHVLLALCMIIMSLPTAAFAAESNSARATYPDFRIVFSNINKSQGSATSPNTNTIKAVLGKGINGYAMLKISDLKYMGAKVQQNGTRFYVTINGQTILFTKGSTSYTSTTPYSIKKPAGGTQSYTFSVSGTTESGTQCQDIDGIPYVRLTHATHQCGALLVNYSSTDNTTYVFDFRVNGETAASDPSTYIVGGSWLTSWDSKGTTQLSPNFKANELWYTSTTGTYHNQLKISVASLQSEENIRYHYNDNKSINVTSGFRTWQGNWGTGGADRRSVHMRGRAIDATASDTIALYRAIYNEFCNGSSTPLDGGKYSWYTRANTATSKSGAYDLERMPQYKPDGVTERWWVHLGVEPKYSSTY